MTQRRGGVQTHEDVDCPSQVPMRAACQRPALSDIERQDKAMN
jgi:hypothetical protein